MGSACLEFILRYIGSTLSKYQTYCCKINHERSTRPRAFNIPRIEHYQSLVSSQKLSDWFIYLDALCLQNTPSVVLFKNTKIPYIDITNQKNTIYSMFNILPPDIVFQEVPEEISLALTVTGCQIGCKGCHSPYIWNPQHGMPLTATRLAELLDQYETLITCVVFFGGEWQPQQLCLLLSQCQTAGFKTCLYTGEEDVSDTIKAHLDYLKTGPWRSEVGGLASRNSNQRFIDIASKEQLNHLFIKD